MFASYSWSGFLWFSLLVAITYYLFIGWLYYRKDIYRFMFYKRDKLKDAINKPVNEIPDYVQKVHELVSELGMIIRNASEDKLLKAELLFALQQKIKNFTFLETTEYKGKINLYIAEEMEIYGIHGIMPEEIEHLWNPLAPQRGN
jgi:hypothetical protein